jgi:Ca2+-binding RTX toxin-like protein
MYRSTRRLRPLTVIAATTLSVAAVFPAVVSAQAPAPAETGIVRSTQAHGMTYTATAADNNVSVRLNGTTFTIDDVVPIQAGAGCTPVPGDQTKVTCTAFKSTPKVFKSFLVLAGAGNDIIVNATSTANTKGVPMIAYGNAGNDELIGDARADDQLDGESDDDHVRGMGGQDTLTGGTGDDDLAGGSSSDTLIGGSGSDDLDGKAGVDLLDGGIGPDTIDGGSDADTVLYSDRFAAVTVDLRATASPQGEAGEGDQIFRVENVHGGAGDDALWGTDDSNEMVGNGGNDALFGRAGIDRLYGGDGRDVLSPSTGTPDGVIDFVDCDNPGHGDGDNGDIAFRFLADHDIASDCESVLDL